MNKKMNFIIFFSCVVITYICISLIKKEKSYKLSELEKVELKNQLDQIANTDQKYRDYIAVGTLNDSIVKLDNKKGNTLSIEEYLKFRKSIKRELTENQIDSLWQLQHKIDHDNYLKITEIIKQYGYPSKERLGMDDDKIFPILLHPPNEIEPQKYLNEMVEILKPEVLAKRMPPKSYATFYDNIKHKILKEPQLYGTGKEFNEKTLSLDVPTIQDIEVTNAERKKIGLPLLKTGEYRLKED